jgi:hypothetical protein
MQIPGQSISMAINCKQDNNKTISTKAVTHKIRSAVEYGHEAGKRNTSENGEPAPIDCSSSFQTDLQKGKLRSVKDRAILGQALQQAES